MRVSQLRLQRWDRRRKGTVVKNASSRAEQFVHNRTIFFSTVVQFRTVDAYIATLLTFKNLFKAYLIMQHDK